MVDPAETSASRGSSKPDSRHGIVQESATALAPVEMSLVSGIRE